MVQQYFFLGYQDKEIVAVLKSKHQIEISKKTLQRRLALWNFARAGKADVDILEIHRLISEEISNANTDVGYKTMKQVLLLKYGVFVK